MAPIGPIAPANTDHHCTTNMGTLNALIELVTSTLTIEIAGELSKVAREAWDGLANPPDAPYDPFLSWDFLQALEESGCASATRGWQPAHLIARDATRRTFTELPASRRVRVDTAVPALTAQSPRGSEPSVSCSGMTNGK